MKILLVIGTRPEAIKMMPVYKALAARDGVEVKLILTGQHREMVRAILDLFDMTADTDLDVMEQSQTLIGLSASIMTRLSNVIRDEQPDIILVQGDTTSAALAGMLGFYTGCRVGHIEAGLRTGDMSAPFPEEFNRRVITLAAHWHFAPTQTAADNLQAEGITRHSYVVGNTVIDAALEVAQKKTSATEELAEQFPFLANPERPTVLVTAHRRENIGRPMQDIAAAIAELARQHPNTDFILPLHPNPVIGSILRPVLEGAANIHIVAPLRYDQLIYILARARLVLTDSGGIQEEAAAFDVPVLILRNETERMEGVVAGCSKLVGTGQARILAQAQELLLDPVAHARMANSPNPYGDGRASARIADILCESP